VKCYRTSNGLIYDETESLLEWQCGSDVKFYRKVREKFVIG